MSIKYNTFFLLFMTLFLLASSLGMQKVFVGTAGNDLGTVQRLAEAGEFGGDSSYMAIAFLYDILPGVLRPILVFLLGFTFIWYCFTRSDNRKHGMVLTFLCFIPCIMTVASFQKDLLLVAFTIPAAYIITSKKGSWASFAGVIAIYATYAVIFRFYFLVIASVLAMIFINGHLGQRPRLILWMAAALMMFFVPVSILQALQEPRDIANANRLIYGAEGVRTAFLNPLPITSLINFVGNYIYAIYKLNFSFIGTFSVKDGFFLVYIGIYYRFVVFGLRCVNPVTRMAAMLVLSHILVLHLFEPDTGSYARHLSSTLPFLSIIIAHYFSTRHRTED